MSELISEINTSIDSGTDVVVLGLDASLGVLSVQVPELGGQGGRVVQQRDAVVQTAQHSLRMRLELRRVRVVTVHALEQPSSVRVVVEHPAAPHSDSGKTAWSK